MNTYKYVMYIPLTKMQAETKLQEKLLLINGLIKEVNSWLSPRGRRGTILAHSSGFAYIE
ncbi:hypothetical protein O9G_005081 [Rozella allomycis CSF55]|uniref:Uncharacterized protein n=1 Tax=Rozella allomycis (strain CSF55) TaxID=988480 RepID=A0A075B4X0_ROZAC|nr:hypothetical protein O9G_005081 [Rozella allomycis CSF55]|eukprot:EPZ36711.1 hypothetical protein O9G_005081 [Rozella allomycis CSF55]